MRRYHLDGLRIETAVHLPGVEPLSASATPVGSGDAWKLTVEGGKHAPDDADVSWTGHVEDGGERWARYGRLGPRAWVRLEGLCDLVVDREGKRASIHPASPSADPSARRGSSAHQGQADPAYLIRRCLPYLVALSGHCAMHAAALVLGDEAALVCAPSGTGKSTLVLAADATGLPVLADDHVALTRDGERVLAWTSFPWIEVVEEARRAFRPEDSTPGAGKLRVLCKTSRPGGPVPVRTLAFLQRGPVASRTSLKAGEVVRRLVQDAMFVGDPSDPREHVARLDLATHVATRVGGIELTVPEGLPDLAASWPKIERALRGPPGDRGARRPPEDPKP